MAKPDLIYTTYIKTTPEKLWAALTTPEFTRQYWGGSANISSWEKGAKWEHASEDGKVHHIGIVEEVIPSQRLVLSWDSPSDATDKSRVTFEIVPVGDSVQFNVVHGDFTPDSITADRVSKGWPMVIANLKTYLETGKTMNIWGQSACREDKKTAA